FTALQELESLVLDRRSLALKDSLAARYADLVYEGRWWSTEREAMDELANSLLESATGMVRLKLYKGSVAIVGRKSPNALYDRGLASFGASESFDHADAAGFVRLFGLPTRAIAMRDGKLSNTPSNESKEALSRIEGPGGAGGTEDSVGEAAPAAKAHATPSLAKSAISR
ncbi:MAG: hypothetical protein V3T08_08840, partial [Gemmatimonadota bacterium]